MKTPTPLLQSRRWYAGWLVAVINAAMVGCAAGTPGSEPARSPDLASIVQAAKDDVAQRTHLDPGVIRLESAESVTWMDGALGCPQPDVMYTQMLVPGYRVRIEAGGHMWDYHAAKLGSPILCPTDK